MEDDQVIKIVKKVAITIISLIAIYIFWPFASVPAGYRGIVTTFGKPQDDVRGEGLHMIAPFGQKMNLVNVSIVRSNDNGEAASKDLQTVKTTITLNYHANAGDVVSIFRNLGNDPETRIVQPSVQEAVKAVTARYTAEELISKRELVRNEIMQDLTARMTRHGMTIDEMSITNFNFSQSFNQAIEGKTTAEQLKLKADRDLERIKVEANQRVATAEGEARSLASQRQQITPELLQLRQIENERMAIEKWDGNLPSYLTAGSPLPFINTGK